MRKLLTCFLADKPPSDKAFEWLQKSSEVTSYLALKVDQIWDPLRSDPRLQDVLRRVNLAP